MAFARSLSKKHHIISTISKTRGVLAIYILFLDPPESINTIVAKIDTSSFTMPFLMEKETLPMTQPCFRAVDPTCSCVEVLVLPFVTGRKDISLP
jgi:hypothetical protein